MKHLIMAVGIVLLNCTIIATDVVAQAWHHRMQGVDGIIEGHSNSASLKSVVSDTCSGDIYLNAGRTILRKDLLGQWSALPFPDIWSISEAPSVGIINCELFAVWHDLSRTGEMRIAKYDNQKSRWRLVTPVEFYRMSNFSSVGDKIFVSSFGRGTSYISTDAGETWRTMQYSLNAQVSFMTRDGIVSFKKDDTTRAREFEVWDELRRGVDTLVPMRLPGYTVAYTYLSDSTIIGGRAGYGGNDYPRLFRSRDQGQSYEFIDSITFVNSGRQFGGSRARSGLKLETSGTNSLGHLTLWFSNAEIATTTDGGNTWWDRTYNKHNVSLRRRSRWFTFSDSDHIVETEDGNLAFPHLSHAAVLPADVSKPVQWISPYLGIITLAYSHGSYVCATKYGITQSNDGGATWLQSGVVFSVLDKYPTRYHMGLNSYAMDMIYPVDSATIFAVSTSTGNVFQWHTPASTWQLLNSINMTMGPLSVTPRAQTDGRRNTSIATRPQTIRALNSSTVSYTKNAYYTLNFLTDSIMSVAPPYPNFYVSTVTSYIIFDSLTHYSARDSLYIPSDAGATWITAGRGLPINDEGSVVPISNIVRLTDGSLLAGLMGMMTATDTSDVGFYEGGFYHSADGGITWSRRTDELDSNLCVWNMLMLSDSTTLVASVGTLVKNGLEFQQEYTYSMTDGRIIRSTDGGITWTDVYLETRSRPAFTGRREILRHPDGRLIAATMEDGVIESRDGGLTWQTIGDETLLGRFINNIAIDTMGLVYASTDRGIYFFVPGTTSVDDPVTTASVPTLWCYPTPTTDGLHIRVNNLGLPRRGWRTLRLYNLYGAVEADFTTALQATVGQQPSSQRHEFDVNVGSLPRGVYVLALEGNSETLTMKMIITE